MSDDQINSPEESAGEAAEGGQNVIQNLKAEMERKLGNITESMAQSNALIQQQLQALIQASQPQQSSQAQADPESFYDTNPAEYKRRIKEEVLNEAKKVQEQTLKRQTALNNTIYQLSQEFPEIQTAGSDLQKAVLEAHNALPESMRETPEGYELAVQRAAAKAKIKPKSQRGEAASSDDFTMGSKPAKKSGKQESAVTDDMLQMAKLLGRNVDDPDFRKRLEKAASRKNWKQYE